MAAERADMAAHRRIPIAQPLLGEEEKRAVLAVLDSGHLAQGPVVAEFEARFAEWCAVKHAIALSSGTAALHVALLAAGIGPGDEVITSSLTFIASANAVLFVGAKPVFVDVEPETFCLDPDRVEAAITQRTRAILPVHLYGHPAALPALLEIGRRRDLLIIEDACQAHGAEVDGRKVGTFGDVAAFSLYPSKNITAAEGGFITTNRDDIAATARLLRSHGEQHRYRHEILGYNFRLSELHAAIGLAQLAKIEQFNAARRANASFLSEHLRSVDGVTTPFERPGYRHVYHQYSVVLHRDRDEVRSRMSDREIETRVYYPIPVHRQPLYLARGYGSEKLPVTDALTGSLLSLPVHPGLGSQDLQTVVEALQASVAR